MTICLTSRRRTPGNTGGAVEYKSQSECCGRKKNLLLPLEQFVIIYNLIINIQIDCGAHIVSFSRYWVSFLGIRRPGREIDHSPPSSAEPRSEWNYKSNSSVCLRNVERQNAPFYLIIRSTQYLIRSDVYNTFG